MIELRILILKLAYLSLGLIVKLRFLILRLAYPFLVLMGKIHMPYSHKKMSARDYYAIKNLIKKGMPLLSKTDGELTNLFIPGYWSHGAIYIGDREGIPTVVEAIGKGCTFTPLLNFVMSKDDVEIKKPTFATDTEMNQAADLAIEQAINEVPYDYGFDWERFKQKAFYCVELLIWVYVMVSKNMSFKMRKRMGEPEVAADDISKAEQHFETVWTKKRDGTTWGSH